MCRYCLRRVISSSYSIIPVAAVMHNLRSYCFMESCTWQDLSDSFIRQVILKRSPPQIVKLVKGGKTSKTSPKCLSLVIPPSTFIIRPTLSAPICHLMSFLSNRFDRAQWGIEAHAQSKTLACQNSLIVGHSTPVCCPHSLWPPCPSKHLLVVSPRSESLTPAVEK